MHLGGGPSGDSDFDVVSASVSETRYPVQRVSAPRHIGPCRNRSSRCCCKEDRAIGLPSDPLRFRPDASPPRSTGSTPFLSLRFRACGQHRRRNSRVRIPGPGERLREHGYRLFSVFAKNSESLPRSRTLRTFAVFISRLEQGVDLVQRCVCFRKLLLQPLRPSDLCQQLGGISLVGGLSRFRKQFAKFGFCAGGIIVGSTKCQIEVRIAAVRSQKVPFRMRKHQ